MKGLMKLVACFIPSFIAFAAFYLTPKAGASPMVPRGPSVPSQVPTCTFICPPVDLQGLPLQAHSEAESQLFCRYQSIPNDFFCKYFIDTGLLKQDHDNGFCPPVAVPECSFRRRDVSSIQSIVSRQNSERALRRAVKKSVAPKEDLLRREKKLKRARRKVAEA